MKHRIPPITNPLGKGWDQPGREGILVDDTHAVMRQSAFDALLDYTASQPTGCYEGKMWKSFFSKDGWCLRWFENDPKDPENYCLTRSRLILIV